MLPSAASAVWTGLPQVESLCARARTATSGPARTVSTRPARRRPRSSTGAGHVPGGFHCTGFVPPSTPMTLRRERAMPDSGRLDEHHGRCPARKDFAPSSRWAPSGTSRRLPVHRKTSELGRPPWSCVEGDRRWLKWRVSEQLALDDVGKRGVQRGELDRAVSVHGRRSQRASRGVAVRPGQRATVHGGVEPQVAGSADRCRSWFPRPGRRGAVVPEISVTGTEQRGQRSRQEPCRTVSGERHVYLQ